MLVLVGTCRCSGGSSTPGTGGSGGDASGGSTGGSARGAAGTGGRRRGHRRRGHRHRQAPAPRAARRGTAGSGRRRRHRHRGHRHRRQRQRGSGGTRRHRGAAGAAIRARPRCCATTSRATRPANRRAATGRAPMSSGATIAIDTAQFRSGSKSVKFTTPAGTSGSRTAYIRPAAASGLSRRPERLLRPHDVPPRISADGVGPLDVPPGQRPHRRADLPRAVSLRRPAPGHARAARSSAASSWPTTRRPTPTTATGPAATAGSTPTRSSSRSGAWSCAEWQFDGPTNTMRFWLDGAAVDTPDRHDHGRGLRQPARDLPVDRAHASTAWTSAGSRTRPDSARTIWIDDVVDLADPHRLPIALTAAAARSAAEVESVRESVPFG